MLKSEIPPIEGSCSAKEVFGLMALGDSMLPEFKDGAVLVVDPEASVKDGSFVIAEVNDEHILRQLHIQDKRFFLQALNPKMNEEIVEIEGVEKIIGVVIQQGSRRKGLKKYR